MHRKVEDVHLLVVRVQDDNVAKGYVPILPQIGHSVTVAVEVLQPRDVTSLGDSFVTVSKAPVVDTQDFDTKLWMIKVELFLQRVQVAKLATAIASRRVAKVPP